MAETLPPRKVGERIEQLLMELLDGGSSVSSRAEELVRLLVQMYGDGLSRIVDTLDDDRLRQLASDKVVSSLLVLHELHPDSVDARVNGALDEVRPYLGSHAGGVEYLGVDNAGVAHLRLQGSCDGCPASSVTVKMAIETAILDAAPEVVSVEVEGVAEPAAAQTESNFLQIGRKPEPKKEPKWVEIDGPIPAAGSMETRNFGSFDILVAVTNEHTYAYRSDCPGCAAAIVDGKLVGHEVTCSNCGRRYDLAAAGRSSSDDMLLDPIPLLSENGVTKVALPEVVA